MPQDIVHIKLEIDIPQNKWLATFNTKYPELNFLILSNFLTGENTGITSFRIRGTSVKMFISDFKEKATKDTAQILYESENLAILNIKVKDPWILNTLVETEITISYPVLVKNGKIKMEAITNRSKLDKFLTQLKEKKIKAKIERIGYFYKSTLLTQRQNEILNIAYKNGYFDIPRKRSLTEFAKDLQISKSALSENLRRIFKRLSENYIKSNY